MPNSDWSGANETDACVVSVSPGLVRRYTLASNFEGLP